MKVIVDSKQATRAVFIAELAERRGHVMAQTDKLYDGGTPREHVG